MDSQSDIRHHCPAMASECSALPDASLLLVLLDGRLRCVSLKDGRERWSAQLPCGEMFSCGESGIISERRQMHPSPSDFATCKQCEVMGARYGNSSTTDRYVSVVQNPCGGCSGLSQHPFCASLPNNEVDCCLILSPRESSDVGRSPSFEWYFSGGVSGKGRDKLYFPVDVLLEHFSASRCPAHGLRDLNHRESVYIEFDFDNGVELFHLSAERGLSVPRPRRPLNDNVSSDTAVASDGNDGPQMPLCSTSQIRIAVQRATDYRTLFFPPVPRYRSGPSKGVEDNSRSLFVKKSTVIINIVGCLETNSLEGTGLDDTLRIEQTLSDSGVRVHWLAVGDNNNGPQPTVPVSPGIVESSPVVSAYVLHPHRLATGNAVTEEYCAGVTDFDDGTSYVMACCQIPILNSSSEPSKHVLSIQSCFPENFRRKRLHGFVNRQYGVFFSESLNVPSSSSSSTVSPSPLPTGSECASNDNENISNKAMGDGFFSCEESGEEANHPSPNEMSSGALVLGKSLLSFSESENVEARTQENFMSGKQSFFDENFDVLMILGSGASGVVLLTRHRVTGVLYAVKVLIVRDKFAETAVMQEVRLHAVLHNEHIVRYYTCWSEMITPARLRQLASVGLCSKREVRQTFRALEANCVSCGSSHEGAGWLIPRHEGQLGNLLLLKSPAEDCAGVYMAGDDTVDDGTGSTAGSHTEPSEDGSDDTRSNSCESSSSERSSSILEGRVVFLQLEYYRTTLAQRLGSRGSIDRFENIIIALQLFAAVRYVHRSGFLHRDVKPPNIFIDYRVQFSGVDGPGEEDNDEYDYDLDESDGNGWTCTSVREEKEERKMWTEPVNGGGNDDVSAPHQAFQSVFEFLQFYATTPPLSTYLKKIKCAQNEEQKRRAVYLIGKWTCKRFLQVRLGDFSISKSFLAQHVELASNFGRTAMNTTGIGSSLYSSPEQLDGEHCTSSSDAYSCGIVLAEMYVQPKTVSERLHVLKAVRNGVFPESSLLKRYPELCVVQYLTLKDPSHRMSLMDASRALRRTVYRILLSFFSEV
ncbi:protein kinase, putative [Trypanosoma brucei brucei TREU927]|uniref:Protein kinase, putative n=1 Tax=Trypanosoma brucei brucei (strain 927/4 GUTat10.1) TaxID=185431 RepID=Q583N6_TRYB2|nr:protein kinase, putative [Trypanosoma brucei brucei TREU927]AAX81001.1 protein kinase, putative [Trypanosoma brucei]AAZ11860.1 protein kinase, putative [Trypanosoma brucei brucei TREU927]